MHLKDQIRLSLKLDLDLELKNFSNKEDKYTIPVFIPHKGCKNECVFCNQRKISGVIQEPTVEDVNKIIEKSLKYVTEKSSGKKIEIAFFGGSFTGLNISDQIKFLDVANKYIEMGIVNSIKVSTRPDYISVSILKLMKKYKVNIIELGVQSLDDYVLKSAKRGHLKKDVIRASKLIQLFDIKLGHQIMIGLPESNAEKEVETIKESLKMKPDILRIYPVYVIEDTELYDMYKSNKYKPLSIDEALERTYLVVKECKKTDINIIRVGLQSTEIITSKNSSIYGPVSDNFAEYVISKIVLEKLEIEINRLGLNKNNSDYNETFLDIITEQKYISFVSGPKKKNKEYLEKKYNLKIKIKGEI